MNALEMEGASLMRVMQGNIFPVDKKRKKRWLESSPFSRTSPFFTKK